MTRARETAGAARLLALLGLVLGLLAMHGLASPHHAVAAAPAGATHAGGHGPASHPRDSHAAHVSHGHRPTLHATALPGAHAAVPAHAGGGTGGACDLDCPTTMLCLAVLSAALVAAFAHLQRRRPVQQLTAQRRHLPPPAATRTDPPPPDPVAELCISRT